MKNILGSQTVELLADAGYNLSFMRQAKGWRVEDLALRSGLSEKSIKNIESGKDFLFSSLVVLARTFKRGGKDAALSLVPRVEAVNLGRELQYTRLSQVNPSRVRIPKGVSVS